MVGKVNASDLDAVLDPEQTVRINDPHLLLGAPRHGGLENHTPQCLSPQLGKWQEMDGWFETFLTRD